MKKSIAISIAITLLLIISGLAWAFMFRETPDPDLLRVTTIQQELFNADDQEVTPEKRQQLFQEMRDLAENLPEEKRQKMREQMGNAFRERMANHIAEFAALPESERDAFLDADIDRWGRMRQSFSRQRPPPGNQGDAERGRPGGGPPWARGQTNDGRPDAEQRRDRRREMLDVTTPEQRAQWSLYMEAMQKRREERGLPAFGRR